jgi:hypothetical protein
MASSETAFPRLGLAFLKQRRFHPVWLIASVTRSSGVRNVVHRCSVGDPGAVIVVDHLQAAEIRAVVAAMVFL